MQPSRSLLIINFRSARLTAAAIRTARAASSEPLQVVVVDNSCDDDEAKALASVDADEIVVAERNLGYAGGINRGAVKCQGEILVVANPDILFRQHSIDLLADALHGHVAMTGPRFTWDDGDAWFLPPAEMMTAATKLADLIGERVPMLKEHFDRKRTRERIAFWSADTPQRVDSLSGAVMCFHRSLLDEIGPFDERFALYFEEIDFMRRIRDSGRNIVHLPAALCRHLYSQSAGEGENATYAISEIEYLRKWEGDGFVRLMKWIGRESTSDAEFGSREPDEPLMLTGNPLHYLIEVSPDPDFRSAAGHFSRETSVKVPAECWESYRAQTLFLRVVEKAGGAAVSVWRLTKTV